LSKLIRSRILSQNYQKIAVDQLGQLTKAVRAGTRLLDQVAEVGRDLGFSEVTTAATRALTNWAGNVLGIADQVLSDVAELAE
jgi:hypothetical protein